jgi:peptidoglycan/LPS O-acetylase OafA/YrhL
VRLQIPLAITFVVGLFMVVQFFVPHKVGQDIYDALLAWGRIIGAFALVLGVGSLFQRHLERIRRARPGWGYSVVTLASFALMVIVGIGWGKEEGSAFDWLFRNVQVPLDATMFSLLAFFMASAAYRSFRARTPEATLLMLAAVVVMLGRVPVGEQLWRQLPSVTEWIMRVPTVAAKRGIIFGVALGAIATSLRIILGLERFHLGGGGA